MQNMFGRYWYRLWLGLAALTLVLFPFDWLARVWPAYAAIFNRVFVSVNQHVIGHITVFTIVGGCALALFPQLIHRPTRYFGILGLGALAQEGVQILVHQDIPNPGELRDITCDLTGLAIAFTGAWLLLRLRDRAARPASSSHT